MEQRAQHLAVKVEGQMEQMKAAWVEVLLAPNVTLFGLGCSCMDRNRRLGHVLRPVLVGEVPHCFYGMHFLLPVLLTTGQRHWE
jgi:hypothetical protein